VYNLRCQIFEIEDIDFQIVDLKKKKKKRFDIGIQHVRHNLMHNVKAKNIPT